VLNNLLDFLDHVRTRPTFEDWCNTPWTMQHLVEELIRLVADLRSVIEVRERTEAAEITQLRRLLAQSLDETRLAQEQAAASSRTSSRPPSSDPPSAPKPKPKPRSSKRRGAQPGHAPHPRSLVPVAECAESFDHLPAQCGCGEPLLGQDPTPHRHQIVDLPPVTPEVVEHRLHTLCCLACGKRTRATLPEGVTSTGYGPGVEAVVALLSADARSSHATVSRLMRDLFGISISTGAVAALRSRASEAVASPVQAAIEFVRTYPGPRYADETSWVQGNADGGNPEGRSAYLWTARAADVVAFYVALSRSSEAAKVLLGETSGGVLVTDRYYAYNFAGLWHRQMCWAHLLRDFRKISERGGACGAIGTTLLECAEALFRLRALYREEKVTQEQWIELVGTLRHRVRRALERGARSKGKAGEKSPRSKTAGTCAKLLEVEPCLWLFLSHPEVELTNNAAERALRHAVIWRKISFGSQSQAGSLFVARLMTVVQTLKAQGRSVFEFLLAACRAARDGSSPPSLVPTSSAGCAAPT
jgi:transposase